MSGKQLGEIHERAQILDPRDLVVLQVQTRQMRAQAHHIDLRNEVVVRIQHPHPLALVHVVLRDINN